VRDNRNSEQTVRPAAVGRFSLEMPTVADTGLHIRCRSATDQDRRKPSVSGSRLGSGRFTRSKCHLITTDKLRTDSREESSMHCGRWIRPILKATIAFGIMMIPIAPIARMSNEGFGDAPGPIQVSDYWQRASYILMPLGGGIAILAGFLLVIVDLAKAAEAKHLAQRSQADS